MALTRLPGSKWWIETADDTFEIIGTYNKAQIIADIQAIRDTLLLYPSAQQEANDVSDLLTIVAGRSAWTEERRTRVTALINAMYQSYQGDARQLEAAQLRERLDALIELRNRLV